MIRIASFAVGFGVATYKVSASFIHYKKNQGCKP